MKPTKSILDSSFRYVKSSDTDLAKKWEPIFKANAEKRRAIVSPVVVPLRPKKLKDWDSQRAWKDIYG